MADWSGLGELLAGNGAANNAAYQKGAYLGAQTQEAMQKARQSATQNAAQQSLENDLVNMGVDPMVARASVNAQLSGGKLGDALALQDTAREGQYAKQIADPNVPFSQANRLLMALGKSTQEQYAAAGEGMIQNKFSDAAPTVSPPGKALIDQREASAAKDMRTSAPAFTYKVVKLGGNRDGIMMGVDPNGAPIIVPVNSSTDFRNNVADAEAAKKEAEAAATTRVTLPATLAENDKMRQNIKTFMSMPGYHGVYGNVAGPASGLTQYVSQDIANAKAAMGQLDAQSFGVSIEKMRGLGALSNTEGQRVIAAFTRATNPRLSPEEANRAWNEVLQWLDLADKNAKAKAAGPGASPDASAMQPGAGSSSYSHLWE